MRGPLTITICVSLLAVSFATVAYSVPDLEWSDLYDGGGNHTDIANVALCDAAGNLVVGGESADGIDGTDQLVRKLDRDSRETIWSFRFPAYDGNDMALTDMIWDGSGDLLVAGYIRGCDG